MSMHSTDTNFPWPIHLTLDLQYTNKQCLNQPVTVQHVGCIHNTCMQMQSGSRWTYFSFFLCVGEHDYSLHILFPHHPPKVTDGVCQGT